MAKDPAFLFYPGDFQGGTMTMSRHLKGCYIDLLIAQFNSGSLSLEEIRTVLGTDFAAWGSLSKKFEADGAGKFFNARLQAEILKRQAFIKKQSDNGKKGGRKPSLNPNITQTHSNKEDGIEDENEIIIGNRVGVGGIPPSQAQIEEAFIQYGLTAKDGAEFYSWVKGKHGWKHIHSWPDYVAVAISKKLEEKKHKNGKQFATKIDLSERDQSANEFLEKSGFGRTGS